MFVFFRWENWIKGVVSSFRLSWEWVYVFFSLGCYMFGLCVFYVAFLFVGWFFMMEVGVFLGFGNCCGGLRFLFFVGKGEFLYSFYF